MTSDVRMAVLSLSAQSPEGLDERYLEWHLLDHMPEQYRIDGLRSGLRWVSTPACRSARAASDSRYDAVDHVVQYLFAEPLEPAIDHFFALGADLRQAGRMPLRLPSVELAAYDVLGMAAAGRVLVDAGVLPWRPMRGVYLLLERAGDGAAIDEVWSAHLDELAEVDGVAGVWRHRGGRLDERFADTTGLHLAVCYLDDDPVVTAERLAIALAPRWEHAAVMPLLAAPFELVTPWAWGRSLPS